MYDLHDLSSGRAGHAVGVAWQRRDHLLHEVKATLAVKRSDRLIADQREDVAPQPSFIVFHRLLERDMIRIASVELAVDPLARKYLEGRARKHSRCPPLGLV